ncbi:BolA protein [Monaibacterium marinum]|uniref:BolA protein n=1 Tax=Pontivivens marinum TaxID=1690039 RepID=A0A2C9CPL0_9RHOB|nr:BolA family protein [Monaibacterium marinum]SOH93451.1 BolA protein [Monaibacterium marinum]
MRVADHISLKLKETFAPQQLEVVDESHLHAGHAGAPEGGQSHFRVFMRAETLDGLNRVAVQRRIYAALKAEMAGPIHALALDVAAR